jgi:uncharacterized surface protein with fasciclin (FAS1) repeats
MWVKLITIALLVAISSTLMMVRAAETAAKKDIVDTIASMPELSKFADSLKTAGLVEQLKGAGPFTVFAPNNDAFEKMPDRMKEFWTSADNKDRVVSSLKNDIVNGKMTAEELKKAGKAETLGGREATIESSDSKLLFNNAEIVKTDIECSNGMIQVVSAMPRGRRGAGGPGGGGRRGGDAAPKD